MRELDKDEHRAYEQNQGFSAFVFGGGKSSRYNVGPKVMNIDDCPREMVDDCNSRSKWIWVLFDNDELASSEKTEKLKFY